MTPKEAYEYVNSTFDGLSIMVIRKYFREERTIAASAEYSYYYAYNILRTRFYQGESTIATSAYFSYYYTQNVVKGRFLEGEPTIATSELYSPMYEKLVKECEGIQWGPPRPQIELHRFSGLELTDPLFPAKS